MMANKNTFLICCFYWLFFNFMLSIDFS